MKKKKKITPYRILYAVVRRLSFLIKDDKTFVSLIYFCKLHKRLNLKNPKTYNEKLQWLKLYNRKPEYTQLVDKYEVKEYVANIIGKEHIIPTIGVWEKAEDIDFKSLPQQFVLKTTHDSGGLYICKDKKQINVDEIKRKMTKALKRDFYRIHREYPYKDVKRRIIAEQFMIDDSGKGLRDYKFFCFDGEPKIMFVATDRPTDTRFDFFDMDFNHLQLTNHWHPNNEYEVPHKPQNFEKMKELIGILAKDIPHVRVDFYEVNGQILFGEMTFFDQGGFLKLHPSSWENEWGDLIKLPLMEV